MWILSLADLISLSYVQAASQVTIDLTLKCQTKFLLLSFEEF